MLPGTGRVRIADTKRLAGVEGAHDVDDEAIGGPISAANDVAGAGGGDGDFVLRIFLRREKRISVGAGDKLRTGLAVAVGIVAAEGIVLAIGPDPLLIFIAFVGGDDDDSAHGAAGTHGFQQARGAEHVGFVGANGILIGGADREIARRGETQFPADAAADASCR